jgi:uncharacterized protein YdaU (DUF1376 family)
MHHYQHHIGDYRRDTMHLTLLEHGVYRQLLDMYYLNELPIPKETQVVFRRLSARTQDEQNAIETILKEFFKDTTDGWIHTRCDIEITAYHEKAEKNRINGKSGGRPKKTQVVIDGLSDANPSETQNNLNHEPLTINHIDKPLVGNKVSSCPYQEIVDLFNSTLSCLPAVRQITEKRKKAMNVRWKESEKRQSLEWWQRFFEHINQSDFLTGRNGSWGACCFDWILKQENFVKILEGNYDNGQRHA